jgi:hypothetical protein
MAPSRRWSCRVGARAMAAERKSPAASRRPMRSAAYSRMRFRSAANPPGNGRPPGSRRHGGALPGDEGLKCLANVGRSRRACRRPWRVPEEVGAEALGSPESRAEEKTMFPDPSRRRAAAFVRQTFRQGGLHGVRPEGQDQVQVLRPLGQVVEEDHRTTVRSSAKMGSFRAPACRVRFPGAERLPAGGPSRQGKSRGARCPRRNRRRLSACPGR